MTASPLTENAPLPARRARIIEILHEKRGLIELDEPIQLASGDWSRYFIDGKRALKNGADLNYVCDAMVEWTVEAGIDFTTVGGLTAGADQFAHVIASRTEKNWFMVRKAPKDRGTRKRIEGDEVGPGVRVLLVDDVVTKGGSIVDAFEAIVATGAQVVGAATLVDRGENASPFFTQRGIPYHPLVTYRDLGIPAIGVEEAATTTV